jgi:plastocyanin
MRILLTCLSLGLAVGVLNCGSSDTTDNNRPPTGCNGQGGGPAGQVEVGNNLFRSAHNGTCNPAIDTVAVGSAVTWTWVNTGVTPHSVQSNPPSQGAPSFQSSNTLTGAGSIYSVTFTTPGTYEYDCVVHGSQMTGRVVVQ